jgi:hypothetical protein
MADLSSALLHHYSAFGLNVQSDFKIPDLLEGNAAARADVVIRSAAISRVSCEISGMQITSEGALLNVPTVGRYLIQDGRNISVQPEPGAAEKNVRLYLLGSAMGMLLHQRMMLPLHANAVLLSGAAVAFLGHPGAGKSTMAAWFADKGYELLSDDVCLVTKIKEGYPTAHVGLPRIRLWREAMEASGRDPAHFDRSFDDMDKYDVPLTALPSQAAAPLGALYVLSSTRDPGSPEIRRLVGTEALDAVIANTYRGSYVNLLGAMQTFVEQCIQLVRQIPVFEASREWGFEVFDEQAQILERHASGVIAGSELETHD